MDTSREEGCLDQARSLILRQLTRKLREMPQDVVEQLDRLSLVRLEALGDEVFEMTSLDDVKVWLMAD